MENQRFSWEQLAYLTNLARTIYGGTAYIMSAVVYGPRDTGYVRPRPVDPGHVPPKDVGVGYPRIREGGFEGEYNSRIVTMASSPPTPILPHTHKRAVFVHVTFLKIGEINTLRECFDADVLLRIKWREPLLDCYRDKDVSGIQFSDYWNPKVFIDNAIGTSKYTSSISVEFTANGEAYAIERRRRHCTYMEQMELWEFPFDVQDLSVTVMSDMPSTDVELIEDPDEIHKIYKQSFIDEQEWYLYKYIESEKKELAKDRADPSVRRSALTVMCRAARRPAYFVWNMFSVTFLICCLAFVTFAVSPAKPENRLQLSFTLVLTSVAFKFVVTQALPKISYLTYLDRYVMATVVMLVIVCFWHGAQTLIPDGHNDKDYIALVVLGGAYLLYNIQFVFRLVLVPYRKRREMTRKEQHYVKRVQEQATSMRTRKRKKHEKHLTKIKVET